MPTKAGPDSPQLRHKATVVDEIRARLTSSDAAVLTEYRGLTVSELAELRGALRNSGAEYKVFKNTLARRAVEGAGLTELLPLLEGPVAFAFVEGDAVTTAKALKEFGRSAPALVVKGGLLGGRFLEAADVDALAEIAPREELLARLAGGFQSPLTKAAGLFQAFTRNLAYGVQALIDQRVAAGESVPAAAGEEPPAADAAEEPAPPTEVGDEVAEEAAEESAGETSEVAEAQAEEAAASGDEQ